MDASKLAESLAAKSCTDAGLLTELRRAWRGTLDVRDALWWHAHPMTPTPEGQPDPASELGHLKTAVYSRAAAAEPVLETTDPSTGETVRSTAPERALQAALRRQAQNADAMANLLEHFRSGHAPVPAPPPEPDIEAAEPAGTVELPGRYKGRGLPPRRARDILLLTAGVAAGVLGILAVQALGQRPMAPDAALIASASSTPSPTPTTEAVDALIGDARDVGFDAASGWVMVPPDAAEPDPFWIFDEPATLRSASEAQDLGPDIVPSSIRTLASTGQYAVYVAQNRSDEYCLIVRDAGQTGWVSGCSDDDHIRSSGLWISVPVANAGASSGTTDFDATWGPDGSFRFEPSTTVR